jgi:hypothetical protein
MQNRIRFGLVAGVAALAVIAVSAGAASALPPPGDDGGVGDPIERPTTTRPQPTTTTTPRVLEHLTVTTDSVVATATVGYSGTPSLVTVVWGDGTSTSRNPADPTDSPFPDPWTPSDPPGVSVFKHAYAAPSDGSAFPVTITTQIGTETQTVTSTVNPRYRVTQSGITLDRLTPCDSAAETETEWRIVYDAGRLGHRTWELDLDEPRAWVGDYPGEDYLVPDSAVILETVAQPVDVAYQLTETDPIFDNLGGWDFVSLNPQFGSRSITLEYREFNSLGDACRADMHMDIDVQLLKPGLGAGPIGHL